MTFKESKAVCHLRQYPVGAVIFKDGEIIERAWNRGFELRDFTAHAGILFLRESDKFLNMHTL